MAQESIYVLELEGNFFYVGKTTNVDARFLQHQQGEGAEFTRQHKPVKVVLQKPSHTPHDEQNTVIEWMAKHGIERIRGGKYSMIDLSPEDARAALKDVDQFLNRCFLCHQVGHFTKTCSLQEKESKHHKEPQTRKSEAKDIKQAQTQTIEANPKLTGFWKGLVDALGAISTALTSSSPQPPVVGPCFRCGRMGHYVANCFAKRHINGAWLG